MDPDHTPQSEEEAVQWLLSREDAPEADEAADPAEQEADPTDEGDTDAAEVDDEADEADAVEEEAPQEPRTFTVRVDGEERQVPLEELTRDYSGRASTERRLHEAERIRREAMADTEALQHQLRVVDDFRQEIEANGFLKAPTPPNQALAARNPAAWAQDMARYMGEVQAYQAQQEKLSHARELKAHMAEADRRQRQAAATQHLFGRQPESFRDEEVARKTVTAMTAAAHGYGYSEEELSYVDDGRALEVLHDAMKWRQHQARLKEARKPPATTQTAKATATPQAPRRDPLPEDRRALLDLRKSRSMKDAVRVVLARGG